VSRARRRAYIAIAVVLFVVISAGLARILSANGAERTAIETVVRAEARGDAPAAERAIHGCAASCRARVEHDIGVLRRAGDPRLLRLDPSTQFSLGGGSEGTARVAWNTAGSSRLPVVQCMRVRRDGNVVSGLEVRIVRVSRPIGREASCPRRY
jgi:hypothetical protein